MGEVLITKANGERVPFEPLKLERSLRGAGASQLLIEEIVAEVRGELVDGISSHRIYRKAFDILRKKSSKIAARYKVKKALFELGPAGYAFEKFLAEIFRAQSYEVQTNLYLKGKCIQHEIDVRAENQEEVLFVECKFHNTPGAKTDVKTPLYFNSRFLDLMDEMKPDKPHRSYLVTNTRFTEDAIQYGTCAGISMISWDHPIDGNLKDRIYRSGLHPITSISSLPKRVVDSFLDGGIVLARDLLTRKKVLADMGMSEARIKEVTKEVWALLNHKN
jgi:hypothetical protein